MMDNDEFTMPLTPHDEAVVRDTVIRPFDLAEVDLLLDWSNELSRLRALTGKEEQLASLLLAQHCALYAECLHEEAVKKRKENNEQARSGESNGSRNDASTFAQYVAGIGGKGAQGAESQSGSIGSVSSSARPLGTDVDDRS